MVTKICTQCGQEKKIELFVKKAKSPDGYASECKECHHRHSREYYYRDVEASRAKSRENAKKSYQKHKEKRKAYGRRYSKEHRKECTQRSREYRNKNRDRVNAAKRKYAQENPDKVKKWGDNYKEKYPDRIAERKKKYYEKNKEHIKEYKKGWAKKNKERLREYKHLYYLEHIDKVKQRAREYYENNREAVNFRIAENRRNNNQERIAHNIRTRIGEALSGRSKGGRMRNLVGCDLVTFMEYIEALWDENMSWDNYGAGTDKWSIDHILPLSWFNLNIEKERKRAFHYSNTQPMWCSENASKSNRYSGKYKKPA